ncbi:hypothetical protein BN1048_00352 [Jeotgalicoccus saudimassiliensis]|uniref:Uncharacterized protein n=1 Tax=Jeotgalicoccus saudimassiliensis TaxID=1461582 RepID=A0A078LZ29_9STAP|nr:hypothetical protein [Jeotgalicoccus saudimassiliensis]CDZ99225.1 hypothetical protein BN1048_00352 [Jeotgalicoccus saudimassiliensis]
MAILAAGGIYKHKNMLTGGHLISALAAAYTYDEVFIHTNFSSDETTLTSWLKESLRQNGVTYSSSRSVSEPYGEMDEHGFTVNSNVYDTFNQKDKYLNSIEQVILTTDIGERDFRYILNFARRNHLKIIIFSCGEYLPRNVDVADIITLEESGIPNYHLYADTIKNILADRGIISRKHAADRNIPETAVKRTGRTVMQLFVLAAVIVLVFTGGFKLLEYISSDRALFEADISWNQEVMHDDCDTVKTCAALGDEYLEELKSYVDLQDEPYIFFENRTRTTFINYEISDFNITGSEKVNPLPFGKEEMFTEMWDAFRYVFPRRYIRDINEYRLFSDGEGNTAAYVSIRGDGTVLAMDVRDNTHKATQYRNLIHEFGHIYSLPIEDFDESCSSTDISCAKEGSVINNHRERFWSQYDEHWHENSEKSTLQVEGFYNNNVTDFYVPYQATNVKEDYAITFMKFITEKIPANSSQLRDVKVQSMYEDAELVALRVDILKSFVQFEKERAT